MDKFWNARILNKNNIVTSATILNSNNIDKAKEIISKDGCYGELKEGKIFYCDTFGHDIIFICEDKENIEILNRI